MSVYDRMTEPVSRLLQLLRLFKSYTPGFKLSRAPNLGKHVHCRVEVKHLGSKSVISIQYLWFIVNIKYHYNTVTKNRKRNNTIIYSIFFPIIGVQNKGE